jgi:putative ABC transport system ATP-binding protein
VEFAVICDGVTKDFDIDGGSPLRALENISLKLRSGELALISGPSGCGKTTLLSILAGVLRATTGYVSIFGRVVLGANDREEIAFRRRTIGFVFQQYNLLPALTATENAAVPLIVDGCSRAGALGRAAALLAGLGMSDCLDALPRQLSGGQQQRVAIARALVHEPQLVLCDEPTAALDAANGRLLMTLLRRSALTSNRCVIVVTHDNRIEEFADDVIAMEDGQVKNIKRVAQDQVVRSSL